LPQKKGYGTFLLAAIRYQRKRVFEKSQLAAASGSHPAAVTDPHHPRPAPPPASPLPALLLPARASRARPACGGWSRAELESKHSESAALLDS